MWLREGTVRIHNSPLLCSAAGQLSARRDIKETICARFVGLLTRAIFYSHGHLCHLVFPVRRDLVMRGCNEEGLFHLDPSSGSLSLLRPLDYEIQQQVGGGYQLDLPACLAPLWLSIRVKLNTPSCCHRTPVGYNCSAFRPAIHAEGGVVKIHCHTSCFPCIQYELVVEALAGEARGEARVVVNVDDQNDHAPVFLRALHETQITEEDNRHLPKVILKVRTRLGLTRL
ncbi:putative neural-cadherin 2 [Portunus trituberculatus]|uniref:Putative neural-cadherin 2 n=1 Tax=Portunus trituberculatus TaxID=210409 RepID=A0A5B7FF84_PORTR|nr:putative neural-cadherin 2 [Portunus trituberculatus]